MAEMLVEMMAVLSVEMLADLNDEMMAEMMAVLSVEMLAD
jgi:hypothetical protein